MESSRGHQSAYDIPANFIADPTVNAAHYRDQGSSGYSRSDSRSRRFQSEYDLSRRPHHPSEVPEMPQVGSSTGWERYDVMRHDDRPHDGETVASGSGMQHSVYGSELRRVASPAETFVENRNVGHLREIDPVRALLDSDGRIPAKKAKKMYYLAVSELKERFRGLEDFPMPRRDGSIETYQMHFDSINNDNIRRFRINEALKSGEGAVNLSTRTETPSYTILQDGLRRLDDDVKNLLQGAAQRGI